MDEIAGIREGQFIRVYQKITEGKRERIASFQGKVIKVKGAGVNKMITIQNALEGVLVERIYPIVSPTITKIELLVVKQTKKAKRKKRSAKN